jgi:hypothetical protein
MYTLTREGLEKPLLTLFPKRAIVVNLPENNTLTLQDVSYLQVFWPKTIRYYMNLCDIPLKWSDLEKSWSFLTYRGNAQTFGISYSGLLLSEPIIRWLKGEIDQKTVLHDLCMISGWDELHSLEYGGGSWAIFKVDAAWREIEFVTDLETEYLCLYQDSQGFETVEEWSAEEYEKVWDIKEMCNDESP